MKKITFIYLILFILLLILPAVAIPFFSDEKSSENRELAEFPVLITDEKKLNTSFTEQLDLWLGDHIGFRTALVEANSRWQSGLFGQSSEDSIIVGSDNWLFYSETENDYLNVATLSSRNINNVVRTLTMMQDYAEERGTSFVVAVVPNKNTLYGEAMPYYYRPLDTDGNLELLEKAIADSQVNYADVRSALAKEGDVLYQKMDSHWDYRGALIGYRAIFAQSGFSYNNFEHLTFTSREDWEGDLATMLYADGAKPDVQYYPDYEFEYEIVSHEKNVEAITLETVNPKGQGNLVIFRDSFCNAMQVYLAESFENAVLSRAYPYSMDYIDRYEADVCVLEIVERNLVNLAKRAPVMQAPEVELAVSANAMQENAVKTYTEEKNGYVHIYGTISEEYLGEKYQAYLLTQADNRTSAYEMFPIFEQELLRAEKLGDNGFSAYLSEEIWAEMDAYAVVVCSNGQYYATEFYGK